MDSFSRGLGLFNAVAAPLIEEAQRKETAPDKSSIPPPSTLRTLHHAASPQLPVWTPSRDVPDPLFPARFLDDRRPILTLLYHSGVNVLEPGQAQASPEEQ